MDSVISHRSWFSLFSFCFALFSIAFNTSALSNMMINVAHDLGANLSGLQWVMNSYFLIVASCVVLGGQLGDFFGRRKLYLIGILLFSFGLIVAAFSNTLWLLIASRVISAFGCAFMVPTSLFIIHTIFDSILRKTAFAIWGAALGFGFVAGPLFSGVAIDVLGWRWVFGFSIIFMLFAGMIALIAMPESQDKKLNASLDFGGSLSLGISLFGFALYLDQSPLLGYFSFFSIVLLMCSFIAFCVFIWAELKVKFPLIHFAHFREKKFFAANISMFVVSFCLMGMVYIFNIFLQSKLAVKYSALEAAVAILPMTVCFFSASLFADKFMDWMGEKKTIVIGMLLLSLGAFYLFLIPSAVESIQYVVPFMIFGAGIGLVAGPSQRVAVGSVSEEKATEALGAITMVRYLGGAIGIAVISFFATITLAMCLMGILCLMAASSCFFLIQEKKN